MMSLHSRKSPGFLAYFAAVACFVAAPAHAREWYDNTRKHKTLARFVDVKGDTVHLRRDSDQKLIKVKKSRLNEWVLKLLAVLDHKDQVAAAKHLLRQDLNFQYDDQGRIETLNLYVWTDDPDTVDPDDQINHVPWPAPTDADLEQAAKLPHVKQIYLTVTDAITPAGVAQLTKLPKLNRLSLTFRTSAPVDPYVAALAPLKNIEGFYLNDCGPITDASLAIAAEWKDLTDLTVEQKLPGTPGMTDAGVLGLKPLVKLFGLNVVGHDLSDACLAVVETMPKLERATWGSAKHPFTARGARYLASRSDMTGLTVRAALSDDALPALANPQAYYELDLHACQVSDAQLAALARFTGLTQLNLSGNPFDGTGLSHLAGISELYTLDLRDSKLTAAGLTALAGLPFISSINLSGTPITDDELKLLEPLNAETLYLSRTAITNAGLLNLKGNKNVKWIHVNNSSATPDGVAAFLNARESAGAASITADLDKLVNAPVTKGDPAKGKTPEETFAQIKEAGAKDDWATVLNCLAPKSRAIMPAMMAIGQCMGEGGDDGKKLVERFIPADKLDGFVEEAAKIKSEKDAGPLLERMTAEVKNPAALFAACVKLKAATHPDRDWLSSLPTCTLEDVKVLGDTAFGDIHIGKGSFFPTVFSQIDGVWYVEFQ